MSEIPAPPARTSDEPLTRVMALHALAYCERLYYLEEVEEIRVADDAVFAGRELHAVLEDPDLSGRELRSFEVASDRLGLAGRVDALRRRDGGWIAYEHKRGRSARGHGGAAEAWPSDRLQVAAYTMLIEEEIGEPVREARIRYHETEVTVRVDVDDSLRDKVRAALARASELRASPNRPPVTTNPRLCLRCSLAPVCLPEESRLSHDQGWEPLRLFSADREGTVLHVISAPSTLGRSGDALVLRRDDDASVTIPIAEVDSVVVHGAAQITTQALHLCAARDISVHWVSGGGRYLAGTTQADFAVQRRLRQYEALTNDHLRLRLARQLCHGRVEGQLRFLLRATRQRPREELMEAHLSRLREQLRQIPAAPTQEALRGHEGAAAHEYFSALPQLIRQEVDPRLLPVGRSRRPPRDRFNALLSFLYALLFKEVAQAIRAVGLDPALGFFHTPRTAAPPLVLDLMELFRVPVCDIVAVASVNRRQWSPETHFVTSRDHVWLSDTGRRQAIEVFERRLEDRWKHPVIGYSLTYRRAFELEVRLLEKEWSGDPQLFAQARLR
jgi:CRISPR-associated protein Cas1